MLVVCNGMIRSGSTLQYNYVRSLVERVGVGRGHGYYGSDDFAELSDQLERWSRERWVHVIKSHDLHPESAAWTRAGRMRICYIYRDIRDVAVSAKEKWGYGRDELIPVLDRAIDVFYRLRSVRPRLCQRYENVVADPIGALRSIARYLELEAEPETLLAVQKACSADAARRLMRRMRLNPLVRIRRGLQRIGAVDDPTYDDRTLLHPDHISRHAGGSGQWESALSTEEQQLIGTRYRRWLEETGYRS